MTAAERWRRRLDPAGNPAVLDTLTWDPAAAAKAVSSVPARFWERVRAALPGGGRAPDAPRITVHERSAVRLNGATWVIAECSDGQHLLAELGGPGTEPGLPGAPFARLPLPDGGRASFHDLTSGSLHRLYGRAAPARLPRTLPGAPRLGVGTRMSTAVWPGLWRALQERSFGVNAIQNSQRELGLLAELEARRPAAPLYYPGVGFVPEGHTGSTFEGLWLRGVVESLKAGVRAPFGADADHIMVKRGPEGQERARRVIAAARYYSFFTIDASDVLDYRAGPDRPIEGSVGDERTAREVRACYRRPFSIGGARVAIGESQLAALVGKYWVAMEALSSLVPYIRELRAGAPFDLELSVDEHPPEVRPFDCITSEAEVAFILAEARRRGLRLTHLAPNLGVEKHVDYRCPDGLAGLQARTSALHRLAAGEGVVIDCHSGDDLSAAARQALRRATDGMLHFKVSPSLQELFAEVLVDFDPPLYREWWDDAVVFARANARAGSAVAADCLREYAERPGAGPHPSHRLFRLYGYASVGKRDRRGDFVFRGRLYSLGRRFSDEYARRVSDRLCALAGDLFR